MAPTIEPPPPVLTAGARRIGLTKWLHPAGHGVVAPNPTLRAGTTGAGGCPPKAGRHPQRGPLYSFNSLLVEYPVGKVPNGIIGADGVVPSA